MEEQQAIKTGKNPKTDSRSKFLHIRLKETEYEALSKQYASTTEQTLSEFVRKKLLDKPLMGKYRNKSVDDCMSGLIMLRNDLGLAGNHFSNLAEELNKPGRPDQMKEWARSMEKYKTEAFEKMDQIKVQVDKIYEAWLQTSTMEKESSTR